MDEQCGKAWKTYELNVEDSLDDSVEIDWKETG